MANSERILAAVIENGAWVLLEIDRGVRSLQSIVGGHLELVPLADESVSKIHGLPTRAVWIDPETHEILDCLAGDMVALGPADEEGDDTPATEATLAVLNRYTIPVVSLKASA